jgi:peptidoglycan/LPS O-acetylase OafA/YrhL
MTARAGRVDSLDGLRGVAAIVVLVHHSLLLVPRFASPYYFDERVDNAFVWAMTYTPLHLIWMGTEAVFVFFVLSGVVLALQVTRSRSFSWRSYFPSRLVRLYLPVFGAVLLAVVLLTLVPRSNENQSLSIWALYRAREYTRPEVIQDLLLVNGTSGVVSPLWSLRWEVIFSLALPMYTWLAARRRGAIVLRGSVLLLGILAGAHLEIDALIFLPIFGLGVLIAMRWDEFTNLGERINASANRRFYWSATTAFSVFLLSGYWLLRGAGVTEQFARLAWPMVALGAVLVVLVACSNELAVRILTTRAVQWTGKISFSLYLVHEPILLTARHATPELSEWVSIAVGVPASLVAAVIFWHTIERPSHALAKYVQSRLRARTREHRLAPPGRQ